MALGQEPAPTPAAARPSSSQIPPQTPPRVQASPSWPAAARGHRYPRGQGTGKILIHPKSREPNPLPRPPDGPNRLLFFFSF